MTKKELIDIINKEVNNLAIDSLSGKYKEAPKKIEERQMNEDDFDDLFFSKKEKYEVPLYTIREAFQKKPEIMQSEVDEFENEFNSFASSNDASVVFDTQRNGKSIALFKKPDGVEAYASGIINFGVEGKIYWVFSLLKGLSVGTENLEVERENKEFINDLYAFYDGWQEKWRDRLVDL